MKKRNVIVSSNYNPLYVQYIPLVCSAWIKLGFKPHLVLITDKTEDEWAWLKEFANVIHEPIRKDLDPGIWSKVSRILHYPDFKDEVVMLSDIDMLPLSSNYFNNLFDISESEPDKLVSSSYDSYISEKQFNGKGHHKFAGCYMLATGNIWNDIINPKRLTIDELLNEWKPLNLYDKKESLLNKYDDFSEESLIRRLVANWDPRQEYLIKMKRGWINNIAIGRIDRANFHIHYDKLEEGFYVDCHSPRPLETFKEQIYPLVDYLELDRYLIDLGIKLSEL